MPRKQRQAMQPAAGRLVRCAIYTRKSTEEGLEQSFNSLDAQREAAEAYIASQRHQGWILLPDRFDDGGYTGANMDRPAVKRLMALIDSGGVDCVVVYKVDRLSRSLLDFARIMEVLEQRGTSFVSITQQFNTTASIGRLTLNILLSFAQFERELISERTRDKMSAARRKGKWVGGIPPLGYDVAAEGGRLVVNEAEAELVREIFWLYLERQSVLGVVEELNRRGRTTKQWTSRRGREHKGLPFSKTAVSVILNSRTYTGQVQYRGETYSGEHTAVIDSGTWEQVQRRLRENASGIERKTTHGAESPLSGLLYCAHCGVRMVATYTKKAGRRYRYYVCSRTQRRGWNSCPTKSVSAAQIEEAVRERLRAIRPHEDEDGINVEQAVERISYDREQNVVRLVFRREFGGQEIEIPLVRLGHREKRGRLPRIARLMALAIRFEELLRTGVTSDYAELARLGGVTRARMTQIMNLLNLAPHIQEEILFLPETDAGTEPFSERARRRIPSVLSWDAQVGLWNALPQRRPSAVL